MDDYKIEFDKIKNILKNNPKGLTILEISSKLDRNRNTTSKYLDILLSTGQIEVREVGPAKIFFLSKRVPLSALLNFSSDYIILLDEKEKIVQISENFSSILDLSLEIIGKNIDSIKHSIFEKINLKNKNKKSIELNLKINKNNLIFLVDIIPTTFYDTSHGHTLIFHDITLQKNKEKELKNRLKFENLLINIATNFINIKKNKVQKEINKSLEEIKDFAQIDIATIYMFSKNKNKIINYAQSKFEKIKFNKEFEKGFLIKEFEWWNKKLNNSETIYSHYSRLPNYAKEKGFLKSTGIKSITLVPIKNKKSIIGFIGFISFNEIYWNNNHIALLELIGKIFEKVLN